MLPFLDSLLHKRPLRDIACRVRRWWLKGTPAVCGWYPGRASTMFLSNIPNLRALTLCSHLGRWVAAYRCPAAWRARPHRFGWPLEGTEGWFVHQEISGTKLNKSMKSLRLIQVVFQRSWPAFNWYISTRSALDFGQYIIENRESLVDADVLWGRSSAQFQLKKTPCQLSKRLFDWAPHIHRKLRWSRLQFLFASTQSIRQSSNFGP